MERKKINFSLSIPTLREVARTTAITLACAFGAWGLGYFNATINDMPEIKPVAIFDRVCSHESRYRKDNCLQIRVKNSGVGKTVIFKDYNPLAQDGFDEAEIVGMGPGMNGTITDKKEIRKLMERYRPVIEAMYGKPIAQRNERYELVIEETDREVREYIKSFPKKSYNHKY